MVLRAELLSPSLSCERHNWEGRQRRRHVARSRARAAWEWKGLEKQWWKPVKLIFAPSLLWAQCEKGIYNNAVVKIHVYTPECTQGFKWIGIWGRMVTVWAQLPVTEE